MLSAASTALRGSPRSHPSVANFFGRSPAISPLLKSALHIHPKRTLPAFATPFTRWRRLEPPNKGPRTEVFLWADTFNNYMYPKPLEAAHAVLSAAGFCVQLTKKHLCCGRPLYDFGMLDTAKQYLLTVLDALAPQLAAGTPVVVLEPSCATVFTDELPNLLPNDPRAKQLAAQTFMLSEFLVKHAPEFTPPKIEGKLVVHGHCHHRASSTMNDEMALLKATGAEVELLDSGCCGMAGPFGFERDKYEVSQRLAERVLLPAVRRESSRATIVSDGFSCREQITQNTGVRARHLSEILATGNRAYTPPD